METSIFGNDIIVKIIGNSRNELPLSVMDSVKQEIGILQLMSNNRHFPKFIGYCEKPVSILMKFYECGSLETYLMKPLGRSHKLSITSDIAQALLALHRSHIAHCDLKPANVLLEMIEYGHVLAILTDFGISRITSDEILAAKSFHVVNLRGLSWQYAAPEVIQRFRGTNAYNSASILKAGDLYAFAIIIYELLNGK
jgi:serine/threonine-protein kinase